jgi:hypothetical protein
MKVFEISGELRPPAWPAIGFATATHSITDGRLEVGEPSRFTLLTDKDMSTNVLLRGDFC